MHIELRYFDGCPNWRQTKALLDALVEELGAVATVTTRRVETHEQAIALGFPGSPTLLVDGEDPFAEPGAPVGLACRIYRTDNGMKGAPSEHQLRTVLAGRG